MADYNIGALIAGTGGITPPKFDFQSAIGDLPKAYWEGQDQQYKQQNRDLFREGIPRDANGQPDLSRAYEMLLRAGGAPAAKEGLGGLMSVRNQEATAAENGALFGTPSRSVALPPATGSPLPAPVQPRPTVMGDAEGVRAGVYDPPTQPGARPPIQPDAAKLLTPNARVAQGFNPAAPVAPAAAPQADPTLGGLIPSMWAGREGEYTQTLRRAAAAAAGRGDEKLAKQRQDHADAIDKALGQYRESGLKERTAVVEAAVKPAIERLQKSQEKADSIADGILVSHDLLSQLDSKSGIFSGQWANERLALAKVGKFIGLDVPADKITNTEAFSALVGKKVAQTVKAFGSGTSITNQDREYAAKMEAGDIKLDETSMRRIIEITDKINRGVIQKHNEQVDALTKSRPELAHLSGTMKVEMPPAYSAPKTTYKVGQTATNPQTGQRVQFNGTTWAPVK